jgi:hypothetical protein
MLSTLVQTMVDLPDEMEREYDEGVTEELPNAEQLAIVLAAIRDCRAGLAVLYGRVEAGLLGMAGEKRFVVDGLGEVEIKRSTKRSQWDSEGLTRKLVALALDERQIIEETGEYEPAWEAVARVLMDCARPAWRVLPLRARGLQVDEWCREEEGTYSVQLPPRGAGR